MGGLGGNPTFGVLGSQDMGVLAGGALNLRSWDPTTCGGGGGRGGHPKFGVQGGGRIPKIEILGPHNLRLGEGGTP